MRKLVAVAALILSAVWFIPSAFAVAGDKGFYYPETHEMPVLNEVLAKLVEASYARDPSGNALLSAANCAAKGGCGTPNTMRKSFEAREGLPRIGQGAAPLAAFLRSLQKESDLGGRYDVASLRPDPKEPGGYRVIMDGVQRGFEVGEDGWVYVDKQSGRKIVVLMAKCANPVYRVIRIPVESDRRPPPSRFPGSKCPDFKFVANAWRLSDMLADLRKEAEGMTKAAEARDSREGTDHSAYQADAFSRTLGRRVREEVKVRAPIDVDLKVRYVDQSGRTVQDLGVLRLTNGMGTFTFPDDVRQRIVEISWPAERFVSPTLSAGERRLRLYPPEWKDVCTLHVHGVEKE